MLVRCFVLFVFLFLHSLKYFYIRQPHSEVTYTAIVTFVRKVPTLLVMSCVNGNVAKQLHRHLPSTNELSPCVHSYMMCVWYTAVPVQPDNSVIIRRRRTPTTHGDLSPSQHSVCVCRLVFSCVHYVNTIVLLY